MGELAVPFAGPRVETAPAPKPFNVAIVGMGCLLPKAPNVRAFWANILNKVDAISEIPKERFNIDLYYDPDRKAKDKMHSRWGGFLDPVPFDPMRYGIPPTALPSIDPMQLLALVTVDQALRDAGYHDRDFPREKTSVILGLSGGLGDVGLQYAVRSMLQQFISKPPAELLQELPEWTEDSFAGLLLNVAAGRVANRFDLGGVNFSVDAACASSLAAVYLAARELADHSSDMAIVGGVDTAQSPFGYMCFAKAAGALRPRPLPHLRRIRRRHRHQRRHQHDGAEAPGRCRARWRSHLCGDQRRGRIERRQGQEHDCAATGRPDSGARARLRARGRASIDGRLDRSARHRHRAGRCQRTSCRSGCVARPMEPRRRAAPSGR